MMGTHTRDASPRAWLVLVLAASWLALGGCGGGAHSNATSRGTGQLTLRVVWPAKPVTNRLVPQAANSIVVTVYQNGHAVATTKPAIQRPQSTYQLTGVPAGFVQIQAKAFPNNDGTGTPLATGTVSSFQVAAGKTNTAPALSLDSTVKTVTVTATKQILNVPDNVTFTATARDEAGNTVMVAPTSWRWSASNGTVTVAASNADSTAVGSGTEYGAANVVATFTEPNPAIYGTLPVAVSSRGLAASAWPKHRGGAANVAVGLGRRATATAKWVYNTGTTNTGTLSAPAIGPDGTIYVGTGGGQVVAIDGTTGARRWVATIDTSGQPVVSSPAVAANGTVVIGSPARGVYALDAQTGTQRWSATTGARVDASPTIEDDGTVWVGSTDGYVLGLNGATGKSALTWDAWAAVRSSACLSANHHLYFGSDNGLAGYLFALPTYSGGWGYYYTIDNAMDSSPALSGDGYVALTVRNGRMYILSATSFSAALSFAVDTTPGHWLSSPALGNSQMAYVASQAGLLKAYDANVSSGGAVKWSFSLGGTLQSSPAIASDGTVYIGSGNGRLYALDGDTGDEFWHYQAAGSSVSSPAIGADGSVYFVTGPNLQVHALAAGS